MKTRNRYGKLAALVFGLLVASASRAVTLDLTPAFPDLTNFSATVSYVFDDICFSTDGTSSGPCGSDNGLNGPKKVTYDGALNTSASSGLLTVSGGSMALNPDGSGLIGVSGGSYALTANFTGAGLFGGGTVEASGTTTDPAFQSGTIVTGDLFNFGFGGSDSAGIIEFEFNNVGGDMAAFGSLGGIIISFTNMSPSFSGDWDPLLDNNPEFWQRDFGATANVDTFVPVPAALWLFASGLAGLLGFGRKRRGCIDRDVAC